MSARAPLSDVPARRAERRAGPQASQPNATDAPLLARRTVLAGALAGLAVPLSRPAGAASPVLSGRIYYRERIVLPADARVEVSLLDVARADAPARTIATRGFPALQRNPLPFVLAYDPAQVAPGGRYGLRARILSGDALLFTSTGHHPVLGGGAGDTEIRVVQVAAGSGGTPAPQPASPVGRWQLEDIRGGGVLDRVRTVLEIDPGGRVSGTGGCNRLAARALMSDKTITFAMVATTRMACPPAVMAQEQSFLAALAEVRSWRVDEASRKLYLTAEDGKPLLLFSAL